MIIQNGTPIIGGGGFKLKLFDPICHEGSAVMNRVTNAVATVDDRDVKSLFWTVNLPLVELRMNLVDLSLYVSIQVCSGMKLKRE